MCQRTAKIIVHFLFRSSYRRNYSVTVSKFSTVNIETETAAMIAEDRIIWMDLEMTGLDVNNHHILEASCLVTDKQLNPINEGVNIVINQPDVVLQNMNQWCIEHHGKSGLTDLSRKSKISLKLAEMELLSYVRQHTKPGKCPLAGNSIHEDKKFLAKYMPELTDHFHYRIIDVSTVKELCKRWHPTEYMNAPKKALAHRSLQDIKESIAELQYYRRSIFKQTNELK